MNTHTTTTLVVTVHQPDERLVPMIEAHLPGLAARYSVLVARCSARTHPAVLSLLRQHGASVHLGEAKQEGLHNIGAIRRETLSAALEVSATHLHLCDFDRAIHWQARFPQELGEVITAIGRHDLLVLGRTERAWATHPPYQAETEPLFNRVFHLVTGLQWDVGAGARGFSRRAAATIVQHSQEETVGTDAEWPLLLLEHQDFRSGFRACEGLEFETADRYGPEIEAAGGYAAWETQMSSDPHRWVFRMELAILIAEAALRYGGAESG
jgi:hypothetical protein